MSSFFLCPKLGNPEGHASRANNSVVSSDNFPAIDPMITDREARRMPAGDRQKPATKDQFKRLKGSRAKLPTIPETKPTETEEPQSKSSYAQARPAGVSDQFWTARRENLDNLQQRESTHGWFTTTSRIRQD